MEALEWKTIDEINLDIAKRVKNIRKRKKLSQMKLATKANVSLGSIKRFENTGDISLYSLTKLAVALDCNYIMLDLFKDVPYNSIKEVHNEKRY